MNWSTQSYRNPGFFSRFFGNVLPVMLTALGVIVLIFMSNEGCGDRPQDFRVTFVTLGIGFLAALAVSLLVKQGDVTQKIRYTLRVGIRLFLAYTFMTYGAAKVLDVQFPYSLMTLDSRLIELAPMQMAWAFFSYTYTYQAIVGWSQIVASLLLCSRRTTPIGSILLLTVIGNIVMVNVFYDICVKLNSAIYLVMTLYLLLTDFKRLWAFFLANRTVAPRRYPILSQNQSLYRAGTILRALAILFVLIYPVYDTVQAKEEYGIGEHGPLYGVWAIDPPDSSLVQPDTLAPPPDTLAIAPNTDAEVWGRRWEKLIFDTASIGVGKSAEGLDYFRYEVDSLQQQVSMTFFSDSTLNFTGSYVFPADDRLMLTGIHGQDSVEVSLGLMPEFFRERK